MKLNNILLVVASCLSVPVFAQVSFPGFPGFPNFPGLSGNGPNTALNNMCFDPDNFDNRAVRLLCGQNGYNVPGSSGAFGYPIYPGRLPTGSFEPTDPNFPMDRRGGRGGRGGRS